MMRSSTLPASSAPVRRSLWIPALFVGLMLIVIVVNGIMIYFAEDTFSGLDTEKYYQAGIDYNTSLKDAAASAALGWTAKATIEPNGAVRTVRVAITDKDGAPVTGLTVSLHLARPVSTALDQFADLKSTAPGVYSADIQFPALGAWELRLEATGGKAPWQATQRLFVK